MYWSIGILLFLMPAGVFADGQVTVHEELQETVSATVLKIIETGERDIIGTEAQATVQTVLVQVEEGERAGAQVTFENDLQVLEPGDHIFINRLEAIDGTEYFMLKDFDRRLPLLTLTFLFVGLLYFFARMQGVRALLGLLISAVAILFVLIPLLLKGYPPVLVSAVIAGVILAVVIFVTHGFHARTTIAFLGTFAAVLVTVVIAEVWVDLTKLTGFASDAAVYLNIATRGSLDFAGLLLGSIIIGLLGVLDDVAITQASVVAELKRANHLLTFRELYDRALRVGRDHVGSLVNTLAFAYIGVSLPLVLLYARNTVAPIDIIVNQEIIAAEIVRIIVGSIGLILAVPFTTLIAAWWFGTHAVTDSDGDMHAHSHGQ